MPVGVFQVRAPGLRAEFPPLRALDTTPGNLRAATTSLIGRESEVTDVAAALKVHRLVTLTGVGGVGKTRLAVEVAARLADEFPDGVWVFELAAVTDPAAVPDAVASVLGITQQPGKTVSESVAAALEGRVRLLVIDNCEHLLDAAAVLIEAMLAHSATVRILATSREGLGVPDEQVWPVRSLDAAAGIGSAAVSLFVERAQGIAPGFAMVDGGEAAAVIEICQRLDGIPLAIELAASRMASMTASEMRDRLDHRFRLLVGSRRGLERHHTLRHAVAWSYDLLADTEKTVLERCSVFAGGFYLHSACAIAGSDDRDEYAILEVLDALVRKSLLVADRSSGRTRYSMLETIRQFAEEQLAVRGEASEIRAAHARYFAGREADIMALWDSPRQREAHDWFGVELANLRTAFRWAADHNDVDVAATTTSYAGVLGLTTANYEPSGWAEELIEPASASDHPRLAEMCAVASLCNLVGRIDDGIRYTDAARMVLSERNDVLPSPFDGMIGAAYTYIGHPERWIAWCRVQLQHGPDSVHIRACLIFGLVHTGSVQEAMGVTNGLIEAAEATANPFVLSFALFAYSYAFCEVDPVRALDAARRGLVIAQDSGNRLTETQLMLTVGRLEAEHGDIASAFDHLSQAMRSMYDSGDMLTTPLAALAALFYRLGRHTAAATIAGFALSPLSALATPEINTAITHLRDVLGDATYEALAGKGEAMTPAAMVAYAYDQIDQARAELDAASE
jgi:predicted ATPase